MISCDVTVANTRLTLDARKGIFWSETASLFLADLHLGKIAHFRKAGLPVPHAAGILNLDILESLFLDYEPRNCYFLGDLFHSSTNREWFDFQNLCSKYSEINFHLITGNHDRNLLLFLHAKDIRWLKTMSHLELHPFLLTHEPDYFLTAEASHGNPSNLYRLCGHIHPKIKLVGKGKQQLSMPCFHFSKKQGMLPSFGQFTGGCFINVKEGDRIFGVLHDRIHPIPPPEI
jgi:DNA ligase-associated metallophosphoesterase